MPVAFYRWIGTASYWGTNCRGPVFWGPSLGSQAYWSILDPWTRGNWPKAANRRTAKSGTCHPEVRRRISSAVPNRGRYEDSSADLGMTATENFSENRLCRSPGVNLLVLFEPASIDPWNRIARSNNFPFPGRLAVFVRQNATSTTGSRFGVLLWQPLPQFAQDVLISRIVR